MSSDFIKLYPGFWSGSMRAEDVCTRLVFLAMLTLADENGLVHATPEFLSSFATIPLKRVHTALKRLQQPDPQSTTREAEGRRIEPWGDGANLWRIINYRKYYERSRSEERKTYKAAWMRARRAAERNPGSNEPKCGHPVDKRGQAWTGVDNVDNVDRENENEKKDPLLKVPQGTKDSEGVFSRNSERNANGPSPSEETWCFDPDEVTARILEVYQRDGADPVYRTRLPPGSILEETMRLLGGYTAYFVKDPPMSVAQPQIRKAAEIAIKKRKEAKR